MTREVKTGVTPNSLGKTTRMERRIGLWKKLKQYEKARAVYMPHLSVAVNLAENEGGRSEWQQVEQIPLYLPSSLDAATRSNVCPPKVAAVEEKLREAQTYEALDDLRRQLRARVFANRFKLKNITGQTANTRARQWQKTIDEKAISFKHIYRRARQALLALRGPGEWSLKVLRELKEEDVRAFNERALTAEEARERLEARRAAGVITEEVLGQPAEDLVLGEGRRTISWIWYSTGTIGLRETDNEENIHEGM